MSNEELIEKLKGLQTWSYNQRSNVMYKDKDGVLIERDDIEELINELEKPTDDTVTGKWITHKETLSKIELNIKELYKNRHVTD